MKAKIHSFTLSEKEDVFADENVITFSFLISIKSKKNREVISAKFFEILSERVNSLYESFIKISPMKYSRSIFPDHPIGLVIKIKHLEAIFDPENSRYKLANINVINKSTFIKIIEGLIIEIFEILIQAENYLEIKERFILDLVKEGLSSKSTEFLSIFIDILHKNNFISDSDVLFLETKNTL